MERKILLALALCAMVQGSAVAQGTVDDYKRAEALRGKYSGKVANGDVTVHRMRGQDHKFWYSVFDGEKQVYKEVDADKNQVTVLPENPEKPRERRWQGGGGPQRHWMEVPDEKDGWRVSPADSQLVVFHRDNNLWTRRGNEVKPLTTNGDSTNYYSAWGSFSPDGRYYATVRIKPAPKHYVYYVESSPRNQEQPLLHKQEYAKPAQLPRARGG